MWTRTTLETVACAEVGRQCAVTIILQRPRREQRCLSSSRAQM